MAIVILVRHGRTTANADGILAGRMPGILLDDRGTEQVARVGQRLAATPLATVVTSPLERCQQTAEAIVSAQRHSPAGSTFLTDEGLGECRYGAWTGRPIKELAQEPLWRDIQDHPSTVTFPPHDDYESESMVGMQQRAVAAIEARDARIEAEHGPGAVWVAVSHGDVIKSLVADAFASPLDRFQRIVIDPASVTIVHRAADRPFVLRVNDTGSDPVDLTGLSKALTDAASGPENGSGDAAVGGGAGSD
ncbi:MSMEG_4193 family putative phosphomutase [Ornithinimicrobium murale]|uniref:MSMEG_4193 family putative phosphomutase n=1 Tax=Ornithinimicrobium murale TaxID=1050153 RepID=UPI000E0D3B00|nr:MSMEG_4193 family putative phosphomutase [Ornithinimicrobium murale]